MSRLVWPVFLAFLAVASMHLAVRATVDAMIAIEEGAPW